MDETFIRGRLAHIRELATKADPFTRKRLLALASRYERGLPANATPLPKLPGDHAQQQTPG
jgi:hypothetical protein